MITTESTVFWSRLDIPPPPPECLNSAEALRAWLGRTSVPTTANGIVFGYTVGTIAAAKPEDRDKPRFVYDNENRFLGLAVWSPSLQGWTIGGQIGEIRTLFPTTNGTTAGDLAARPMAGWHLCDGGTAGLDDLRPDSGDNSFFAGTGGSYSRYTVGYTG